MNCDGSCCKRAPMTAHEFKRIKLRHGVPHGCTVVHETSKDRYYVVRDLTDAVCGYLTADKRCKIYRDRPRICRIYGTKDWPCIRCQPLAAGEKLQAIAVLKAGVGAGSTFHFGGNEPAAWVPEDLEK